MQVNVIAVQHVVDCSPGNPEQCGDLSYISIRFLENLDQLLAFPFLEGESILLGLAVGKIIWLVIHDGAGNIVDGNKIVLTNDSRTLQYILQLPDVPRPILYFKQFTDHVINREIWFFELMLKFLEEECDQLMNVAIALPQCR